MSSSGNGNGNGSSCLVPSVLVRPSEGTSKTIVKLGSIPADAGSLNVRIEEELKGIRLVPVEVGSDAADWPFVVRGPVVDASADRPHQVFICIEIDAAYEYVDLYITVVGDDSQANGELFRIPIVVVDESNDAAKAQQPMTQLQLGAMATTAMANWRLLQQRQAAQAAEAADHVIQTTDEPIVEALVLSETAREPGSTDSAAGGATTAGSSQPTDGQPTVTPQPTAAAAATADTPATVAGSSTIRSDQVQPQAHIRAAADISQSPATAVITEGGDNGQGRQINVVGDGKTKVTYETTTKFVMEPASAPLHTDGAPTVSALELTPKRIQQLKQASRGFPGFLSALLLTASGVAFLDFIYWAIKDDLRTPFALSLFWLSISLALFGFQFRAQKRAGKFTSNIASGFRIGFAALALLAAIFTFFG